MDLRVEFEDGTNCNVEIQLKESSYENDIFLYYLSDTYSRQLSRGNEYEQINKTISIIIADYETEVLKGIDTLNVKWQMRDNVTGKRVLTEKFELVIIEIPKAKRIYSKNSEDKISQWMLFLDDPNSQEVSKIMGKNKEIKKAANELKEVSGDYELRRMAELREKAIRDNHAQMDFAIKKGLKQGIQRGASQEKNKIAKKMLSLGINLDIIVKSTGLSEEKIEKLKA